VITSGGIPDEPVALINAVREVYDLAAPNRKSCVILSSQRRVLLASLLDTQGEIVGKQVDLLTWDLCHRPQLTSFFNPSTTADPRARGSVRPLISFPVP
jgi:hypothetical protein